MTNKEQDHGTGVSHVGVNSIVCGDSLDVLKKIKTGSIDMVLTSPPYDNLRIYKGNLSWNFEDTAQELFRVVKDGGVVVWVVGDATIKGSETGTSFKQALYFKEIGFNLHDTMVYEKNSSSFPSKKTDNRYTQIFEYMFVFSKGKPTANLMCDKKNLEAGKKYGVRNTFGGKNYTVPDYSPRTNIWRFTTSIESSKLHPAMFPYELAQDHILTWTKECDVVLDPFAGSGTTGLACKNINRKYILIEKEPEYVEIIKKRLSKNTLI